MHAARSAVGARETVGEESQARLEMASWSSDCWRAQSMARLGRSPSDPGLGEPLLGEKGLAERVVNLL
jgi:hypothetical protein